MSLTEIKVRLDEAMAAAFEVDCLVANLIRACPQLEMEPHSLLAEVLMERLLRLEEALVRHDRDCRRGPATAL